MFDLLPSRSGRILICGHRGHVIDGHENTRPAFAHAAELGASLCELDLRLTKDNQLVVYHDDILDNASTGAGLISQHNYAEIAELRTKSRHGIPISGQPIELFEDSLAFCRDLGLGLIIEVKDKFEGTAYLEQVVALLRKTGMFERVLISSFDYVALRDIKRLAPGIRTMGINYHRLTDPVSAARSAMMDVMNTDYPQFAPDLAEALHKADICVSHYVPAPEHFSLRRGYGVDYHEVLRGYLRAGLIDMLVCDDVAWAVDFAQGCGLEVLHLPTAHDPMRPDLEHGLMTKEQNHG